MWPKIVNQSFPSWQEAYEENAFHYGRVAQQEIVPILENLVHSNRQVGSIKFSDFDAFIKSAAKGDEAATKGIEYIYLLHRILDELVMLWIAFVNSGETKINSISKLTGCILADLPIYNYPTIEQIFDQLGAETYLWSLTINELAAK